jgi:hypothetical protein
LYGILFLIKDSSVDSDVLIGDSAIYNLKSGRKFHILVPGWDFDANKLKSTAVPNNNTHFYHAAFLEMEADIFTSTKELFHSIINDIENNPNINTEEIAKNGRVRVAVNEGKKLRYLSQRQLYLN